MEPIFEVTKLGPRVELSLLRGVVVEELETMTNYPSIWVPQVGVIWTGCNYHNPTRLVLHLIHYNSDIFTWAYAKLTVLWFKFSGA